MAEKAWLKTKSDSDKKHYLHLNRVYKTNLYHSKKSQITNLLDKSKNKSGTLYKILLGHLLNLKIIIPYLISTKKNYQMNLQITF